MFGSFIGPAVTAQATDRELYCATFDFPPWLGVGVVYEVDPFPTAPTLNRPLSAAAPPEPAGWKPPAVKASIESYCGCRAEDCRSAS